MADLKPEPGGHGNFRTVAQNEEEELAFDYVRYRDSPKRTGVLGSIAHIVKGALGGGILGGHVAYMKGGVALAVPLNIFFGLYMGYCLHLLVSSAQVLYRRTRVPTMSYPDVGEAALACFPNPKVARWSKTFRHIIDFIICLDLFGACACYQLIIAKSIKQLVEDSQETSIDGLEGYPNLRVYLVCLIVPIILICLITHLQWLAPFSLMANFIILIALGVAVYYAFENNPEFTNMRSHNDVLNILEFTGIIVFSMSCAGVVIPIENNMKEPTKFPLVLAVGLSLIVAGTVFVSFFGYVGYLDKSEAPITINFPMTTFPKILKGMIAVMIYVTHALNFWPPFMICFYYLKKLHKDRFLMWELIYRAIFVTLISIIAIVFPTISSLMGFLGCCCLTNMGFIWPLVINLLVIWHRPGLGKYKWRLWRNGIMIAFGIFVFICGGIVSTINLMSVFFTENVQRFL